MFFLFQQKLKEVDVKDDPIPFRLFARAEVGGLTMDVTYTAGFHLSSYTLTDYM